MKTPVMVFLSVEPFELRLEVLIRVALIDPAYEFLRDISVEEQQRLIEVARDSLSENFTLTIDEQHSTPETQTLNFVVLNRGGVSIRSNPVPEQARNALIGATFVFTTTHLPDSIELDWGFFPQMVDSVEALAIDPYGSIALMLEPENDMLLWKNSIINDQIPTIEKILVDPYPYPVISIFIWLVALFLFLYKFLKKHSPKLQTWIALLFFSGLIIYPFARIAAILPVELRRVATTETAKTVTEDLLNNVYQAFNRRAEDDVYDCLANSVAEDQLTDIYIDNRRAMVMEDRGGARANVDAVKVLEIYSITSIENGKYEVDVKWTVNGSVNHFGHTHYRQNQYRALVSIIAEEEVWKIDGIESYDIERIY